MAPSAGLASSEFIQSADGTKVAYRSWPIRGATITFAVVHGLGEHSGRYDRFAQGMARFEMATFALDLRGHGKSDGQRGHIDAWSQWVDDAAAFVQHVNRVATGEVVPLGHSFGGVVLLSAVLGGKLPQARRFVLSSPALVLKSRVPGWKKSLARLTSKLAPRLSMNNEVDPATVSRIPQVVEAYRADPLVHARISSRTFNEWQSAASEVLARAGEIRIPFLILAGTDDRLIDADGSRELHARASTTSELHLLQDRYHEPFNDRDSDDVFSLIAEWLRR